MSNNNNNPVIISPSPPQHNPNFNWCKYCRGAVYDEDIKYSGEPDLCFYCWQEHGNGLNKKRKSTTNDHNNNNKKIKSSIDKKKNDDKNKKIKASIDKKNNDSTNKKRKSPTNNNDNNNYCKYCGGIIYDEDIKYTNDPDICFYCWEEGEEDEYHRILHNGIKSPPQSPKKKVPPLPPPPPKKNIKTTNTNNSKIGREIIIAGGDAKDLFDVLFGISGNKKSKNNESNKNKNDEREKDSEDEDEDMELIKTYDYEWLGKNINTIKDLIDLGKKYDPKIKKRHNLNLKKLNKLIKPLEELYNMIGLDKLKNLIFEQIIFYLQELDTKNVDMLHTVIEGSPGVGKTVICNILAKIYKSFGFLKKSKVISVKADDLIAPYVGQTAARTRKKLEEALGGVLFIDEAYSLGDEEGRGFTKEAIDMITSFLDQHPHDLVCIIAGYKDSLNKRFFAANKGLERRFNYRYTIDDYKASELRLILFKLIKDNGWNVDENKIQDKHIEKYQKYFKFNGGDMLTLFGFCKKAHSKRLLLIEKEDELISSKKKITLEDYEKGIETFINVPNIKARGEIIEDKPPPNMYI